MLYHLSHWLNQYYDIPGVQLFQFITFRAAMAIITSLLISMVFGKHIVNYLRKKQIGESIRDLGLEGEKAKKGTPTMGGLIILGALIIPVLLFARLDNIYILLMLIVTVWMGCIGFLDDYIKVFKKDKKGLRGKFKILGQVSLGLIIGLTFYFSNQVKVRDFSHIYVYNMEQGEPIGGFIKSFPTSGKVIEGKGVEDGEGHWLSHDVHSTKTTIPFTKHNEFDYGSIIRMFTHRHPNWVWIVFIPIIILIITAVSNGANLTDGLDGLATGVSAINVFTLLVFAYVSGNVILANYLNIMYIPESAELVIFSAALVGSCIGFLWYNAFPATVFMGDTGSLALGGIIATLAIVLRKELLIPIMCGIFLMENLSVVMQVAWFKYTKHRFGEGRRIFKMSPLHHHYQKIGLPESKIVVRFWIIGILLALVTIITLKIR